jgi:hypothetical protein
VHRCLRGQRRPDGDGRLRPPGVGHHQLGMTAGVPTSSSRGRQAVAAAPPRIRRPG